MSHSEFSRVQASLSIEELFEQPNHHQQQWLLTYLDVFVLIIMLVITLLAISGFETKQQLNTQLISKKKATKPSPKKFKTTLEKPTEDNRSNIGHVTVIEKTLTQSHTPQPIESQQLPFKINPVVDDKKQQKEIKHQINNKQSDESLHQRLAQTVDELGLTDAVKMKVSSGYAQLEIQDKILFKSSNATLLVAGGTLLKKLVPLLEQSSGLIYIEGHTDNRPIKTTRYPSNWELGAARATSVLHYLTSQKLESTRLRAITYGDTKPIADNSTKLGREKNRRVSIVIKVSDKID